MELGLRAAPAPPCISQDTKKINSDSERPGRRHFGALQGCGEVGLMRPAARVFSVPAAAQTEGECLHAAQLPHLASCSDPDDSVLRTHCDGGICAKPFPQPPSAAWEGNLP